MASPTARLSLLGATLLSGSIMAAPSPTTHLDLSRQLADRLVEASLAACHAEQRTAVVAAVDRGGRLVALQRDDGIGPHNTEAAQRKAFTALSTGTSTRDLAEHAQQDAASANLTTLDELLLLGGGVPVRVDGELIGALGVAGAGGAAQDEACALAALDTVLPPQD